MKKIFLISAVMATITLIGFSCKKDKTTPTPNTTTTGRTTAASDGTPSGTYNGFLYVVMATNGSLTIRTGAGAFVNTPVALNLNAHIPATATVNSVYMNGVRFKFDASSKQYADTTYLLPSFPPANWVVNGAGSIPSFTFSNTDALPVYTGTASLPATVSKAQNLVIPITGLSGCDQVGLELKDNTGRSTTVYVAGNATSATFIKDSLVNLTNCINATLNLTLIKYNAQNLGGKNIMFGTLGTASKNNIIIAN